VQASFLSMENLPLYSPRPSYEMLRDVPGQDAGVSIIARTTELSRQTICRIKDDAAGAEAALVNERSACTLRNPSGPTARAPSVRIDPLGLLRSIAIADTASPLAKPLPDEDRVALPLGVVALNWLRSYLPLVEAGLPQLPGNVGSDRLGFAKEGFRALLALRVTAQDLRIGASFSGDLATALTQALAEAPRSRACQFVIRACPTRAAPAKARLSAWSICPAIVAIRHFQLPIAGTARGTSRQSHPSTHCGRGLPANLVSVKVWGGQKGETIPVERPSPWGWS